MNSNNLDTMEKNLRSIAKRYENVKYSIGLAVLFLMKGTSAFSEDNHIQEAERKKDILTDDQGAKSVVKKRKAVTEANKKIKASWATMQFGANDMYSNYFSIPKAKVDKASIVKSEKTILLASTDNTSTLPMFAKLLTDIEETTETRTQVPTTAEINASKDNLRNSVGNLQNKINSARQENNKEIEGLKLELTQLMEQGDQVVKSPWSSWQFGANYMYNEWSGAYKGRGDKSEKYAFEGIFTRSLNSFERVVSPLSEKYDQLEFSANKYSALTSSRKGLYSGYGLTGIERKQEPLVSIDINAAVKPKTIQKTPLTLSIPGINAPNVPIPTINPSAPINLELPRPNTPSKVVVIAKPNAEPFTGYYFDGTWNHRELRDNISIYSGIDPASLIGNIDNRNPTPAAMTGSYNGRAFEGTRIVGENNRYTNAYYISSQTNATKIENNTFYLRGHYPTDTYNDSNTRAHLGLSNNGHKIYNDGHGNGIPDEGVVGIHARGDLAFKNLVFNLYGRAGAITNETWQHGIFDFDNVTVNMYNSDNMGFYNMPIARYTYKYYRTGKEWRTSVGGFTGKANVNVYGKNNSVYLTTGISYMKHWENEGLIQSDGASNIVYSSFSYAPTLSKLVNPAGAGYLHNTNMIKLSNIKLYGDENIGMYFGSRIKGDVAKVHMEAPNEIESLYGYNNKAAHIGIYQGEIDFSAKIGEKLTIDNQNQQTAEGNLNNTGYTNETVDGAVGIFSESGQRVGIVARGDIMEGPTPTAAEINAHKTDPAWERWFNHKWNSTTQQIELDTTRYGAGFYYAASNDFSKDPIHNLEVAKLDIRFGKYSKNGIMVLAKQGTVIDVGKNTSNYHITGVSSDITDGINGANTLEADASTGTIVAYAEGTWDQLKHRYGSEDARIAQNDADAVAINNGAARKALTDTKATTAAKLQGLGSEININPNVVLASKEGIAYMGDNQGIVNAMGTTEAVNYGSIIAYAKNKGQVTVNGAVKAEDKNTVSEANKFKNIGAFAEAGGRAELKGAVTINGIGAFAKGTGSEAILSSTNNDIVINAGTVGGIVATDNGYAKLNGGTINVTKDNSRLFYADATGKIDFTRTTNINVSKGIILPQEESNPAFYNSKVSTATGVTPTKYNGMENVTINLLSDDVVLRTVDNHAPETWTGGANFETNVKNIMKYSALNKNGHTYKAYYTNGKFKIATNINLDDTTDIFNGIVMGNEEVTIDNGISITSNAGKGLAQAALKNTVDNSKTAYINNGTVNITGANSGSIALKVDHGTIENNGLVSMTDGIGLYGSSGSKISNNANGKISISSPSQHGIGIAGFLTGTSAQEYGTDKLISNLIATGGGNLPNTIKTIDITNNGEIEISGKAVGIYADNTSKIAGFDNHVTKENAVVNNNATLSFGDDSVGIYAKKAIVNLSGTGKDDISVGKNGIGVAAEDSTVNLLTDYGFQIKDNGVGLYAKNTDTSTGTMNVRYTGANAPSVVGTGAYFEMTGSPITNKLNVNVENVSNTKEGMIGIYAAGGTFTNEGNVKITNNDTLGFGIIASGADVTNKGDITLEDSSNVTKPNIGMYTAGSDSLKNMGKISVGKNGIGIYGKNITNGDSATLPNSTIEVGENGIGVYTEAGAGENIKLESGSIKAGKDGVGVYAVGNGGTIRAANTFNMTLGDGSSDADKGAFGFVNVGSNNKIYSDISNVTLQNNSIYIYSKDTSGTSANPQIINNTNITATGKNNYGIYSAGYVVNNGNMNLSAGSGNVGVYSVNGGTIENISGAITVGGSVPVNDEYGIGMAAGYTWTKKDLLKPVSQRPVQTTGNIINRGTINVNGQYSLGMYASGNGSTAKNYGTINLNANNTTGMYLTDKAVGHNYGTITNATGVKDVTGVVVKNGAKFINEATGVVSLNATNALGILRTKDEGETLGIIENYGTFNITGDGSEVEKVSESKDLNKSLGKGKDKISIDVPAGATTGTIKLNDIIQSPEIVETKKLELEETQVSTIGMYINTSGVKFTKPITGLSELSQLRKADLIIGAEAAQSTTAKYIQVGNTILKPYNDTILNNPQINKWTIYSGSLTWMANIGQNQVNGTIENAYLAKIPYPVFAKDKNTYNFTDGLEQRYGVEGIGSRENALFQKLNTIGNNEEVLLFQAFDEMMGHQYANTQQRIQSTGSILDKEFNYLRNEWSNPSKDANKIKTFGTSGEYKTETAGVIDYKNNAYGVAYVHEDETVRLGESTGWYAGIVHNTFRFKDIGNSKEEQLQGKVGIFKSVPFDHNNSLNWTVSGEIFAGHNKMHRKFLVVDEVFNAKGRYHTYGAAVKNEISKEFRLSEDFSLRPYASLKLEYGRVSKIREKSGEMRLDVKANDYFSVKPEIGAELAYRHYFGANTVKATVGVAYENELGRIANGKNKAKVAGTDADYFNIRGEKDDRTGNVKTDLNLGWDNQRIGVTANIGYDTKGDNVRAGVGLRVIF